MTTTRSRARLGRGLVTPAVALALTTSSAALLAGPATASGCGTAPVVTVEETAPVLPGGTFHVSGSGFCPGQRMAVKIDRDAYGQVGADEGEDQSHATRARVEAGPDGSFAGEPVVLPRYQVDGKVTEGGAHQVHLLDNDPVVNPSAPFTAAASYTVSADVTGATAPGGTVVLSGTGWLDRAGTGSSTVAVVVEEAGIPGIVATERLAAHRPHANARVWEVVPASAFTAAGTFAHRVTLPDGTTAGAGGSTVPFGGKRYRVRLWSGAQLGNAADITRNVQLADELDVTAPAPTPGPTPTPVVKPITVKKKPVVKGTKVVGRKLRSTRATFNTSKVKVKYQWLRNGHAIKGATASTYTLRKADARKKIRVQVVGTKSGWKKVTVTSKAVTVKKKAARRR